MPAATSSSVSPARSRSFCIRADMESVAGITTLITGGRQVAFDIETSWNVSGSVGSFFFCQPGNRLGRGSFKCLKGIGGGQFPAIVEYLKGTTGHEPRDLDGPGAALSINEATQPGPSTLCLDPLFPHVRNRRLQC